MVSKVKKAAIIWLSMPPQAAVAAAPEPSQEALPKQEVAVEAGDKAKVESMVLPRLESMLEKGDVAGVKEMIRSMAKAAETNMSALQEFPEETRIALAEAAPEEMKALDEAQASTKLKLAQAEQALLADLGTSETANEAPVAAPAPVEAVKVLPAIKIEAPVQAPAIEEKVEELPEKNEMAEQQKTEAQESMKEDLEALQNYAKEHHLALDPNTLEIPADQLNALMPVERAYVAVLQAKYHAGDASLAHAEALMAVAAEKDPAKKQELSAKAFELSQISSMKEKVATVLNSQYMNMPEIIALAGGGPGNPTGGSFSGQNFDQASPFGGQPKGPEEPPKYPGAPLYTGGGVPGDGIAKIETMKTPDTVVQKRIPNFIERFFNRNVKDLTYGQVDPDKQGRE